MQCRSGSYIIHFASRGATVGLVGDSLADLLVVSSAVNFFTKCSMPKAVAVIHGTTEICFIDQKPSENVDDILRIRPFEEAAGPLRSL